MRIAIVNNADSTMYRFRGGLMTALLDQGHQVFAISPPGQTIEELRNTGVTYVPWTMSRQGINPVQDILSLGSLYRIFRRIDPHLVHNFTIKPNIYGTVAAKLAGVPVTVASVTGLGFVFSKAGWRSRLILPWVKTMFRLAFSLCDRVTFQNRDDMDLFLRSTLVSRERSIYIPGGSGVDTTYFQPEYSKSRPLSKIRSELGISASSLVVSLIGRMLWDKGVSEYVQSARLLKSRHEDVEFLLVGPVDMDNPSSIPYDDLADWNESGVVKYLGERDDIRDILALTDISVLPSYREGLPRSLLEASAMGNPIVATDAPGCRDVVIPLVNGVLVKVGDVSDLASAIEALIVDSDMRRRFGEASRKRAIEEWDEASTISRFLAVYDQLMQKTPSGEGTF